MMEVPVRRLILLSVLTLFLPACVGLEMKPSLPDHINKAAIPIFANPSGQVGLDAELTKLVERAFIVDGRLQVVPTEQAEAVLEGVLQKYQKVPLQMDSNQVPLQYKLIVAVDLTLKDLTTKQVLWTTHRANESADANGMTNTSKSYDSTNVGTLTEYTTFYVLNNAGAPPEDESVARKRVFDQMTRRILNRTIYGF
jgi:hypothetical protein